MFQDSGVVNVNEPSPQDHPLCDPARCLPFQCDITSDDPLPFPPASIDLIILIFVLSAIQPSKMQLAVDHLAECLKPGGRILFRDYGRYDMAQLRFKKGTTVLPRRIQD